MRKIHALFIFIIITIHSSWGVSPRPVKATHGMVVSAQRLASEAGVEMLKKGGNSVDAAVAVGFALAVVHPTAGNLGGGGFMVIRFPDGRTTTFDYREKAPAAAHRDMYLLKDGSLDPEKSQIGYLAAGVPGSVAGLCLALEKYGTLSLPEVIKPAIRLAQKGFPLSEMQAESFCTMQEDFKKFPSTARVFYKADGSCYVAGEIFRQKSLAATLKLIAKQGSIAFYQGAISRQISEDMQRNQGLITLADLAAYRAIERPALLGSYKEYEIISMGPPSSGGIAIMQMLNMLAPLDLASMGHNSSQYIHYVTEAMMRAFADRAEYLGDPDFVQVPMAGLLSKSYAAESMKNVLPDRATPAKNIRAGEPRQYQESEQTTHYSVASSDGMAVSVTTTLNSSYGCYAVVEGAGFLLNNEMDDFSAKPGFPNLYQLVQNEANAIMPGKRMLSCMTPTILTRDKKLYLVVGSPGGPTIINTVMQTILNSVVFKMNIQEAVDAPRFHHQWLPDVIRYDRQGLVMDVIENLKKMGHNLAERSYMGEAHSIAFDAENNVLLGAADHRAEGAAVGY